MSAKPEMVDFRLLLNKYIEHVGQCEGTDFISSAGSGPIPFSPAEIAELIRLQEYPLRIGAHNPEAPTNGPAGSRTLEVTPADSAVATLLTASFCKTCLGDKKIILGQDATGLLVGRCPSCNPAPVAVVLPARPRADEEEYERMTDYEKGLLHGGIELWDKIDEAIRLSAKSR